MKYSHFNCVSRKVERRKCWYQFCNRLLFRKQFRILMWK